MIPPAMRHLGCGLALVLLAGCLVNPRVPGQEQPAAGVEERDATWDTFDRAGLSAAIFAETNRVRQVHGLAPLRSVRGLEEAASFQANAIAMTGVLAHDNPFEGRADVISRIRATGLAVEGAWENVASTPLRIPEDGRGVRIAVDEQGRREYVDFRTGEPLAWSSYGDLAARIVEQWMKSPPHRANILRDAPTHLACATALGRTATGGEVVHSVQVFVLR